MSTLAADSDFDFGKIQAELESHIGVSASDDPRLETWYNWARESASRWLCNDFTDDDGADVPKTDGVKSALKLALFEGVRAQRTSASKTPGLTAVSTGSVSETYGSSSDGSAIAMGAMSGLLYSFRLSIELL